VRARYEYEFVTVEPGRRTERDAYRSVIDERAAEGWRLVQILAAPSRRFRPAGPIDLVFERPVHAVADDADVTVVPI
jgi:hypothetical protein